LGLIDERNVLADAVVGFELEAPPVGPHAGTNVVFGEEISDLVGLDGVVKRGDLVAELAGNVDHCRHLVGTVAVIVDEDFAVQDSSQRFQLQVARGPLLRVRSGRLPPAEAVTILAGGLPRATVSGHVSHTRLGRGIARSIDALWILTAGHLQAVWRTGKLHPLRRA